MKARVPRVRYEAAAIGADMIVAKLWIIAEIQLGQVVTGAVQALKRGIPSYIQLGQVV